MTSVHPHVCGEYQRSNHRHRCMRGLPPRVWGIPVLMRDDDETTRFTPTCVGNTSRYRGYRGRLAVHPHVCGEYTHAAPSTSNPPGSPPRVWGIRVAERREWNKVRFTPTCVGNTASYPCRSFSAPVHPHVCGEYSWLSQPLSWSHGSPPRVWGIPPARPRRRFRFRFTPTCVGNTGVDACTVDRKAVHPHVCGEYAGDAFCREGGGGSPPRVWGIHPTRRVCAVLRRFTPTCVGNTSYRRRLLRLRPVHPHVCGEYDIRPSRVARKTGSPPRVWGILGGTSEAFFVPRFTPTCVGNTRSAYCYQHSTPVHPHVCGEYPIRNA